jgi:hypothetical protein
MAERNVPDDINAGVMGNSQGNREGQGETDFSAQRRDKKSYEGQKTQSESDDRAKRRDNAENVDSADRADKNRPDSEDV